MSQPTSARRAATRERLVQAAIGVIAHKGVLGASVEEICEAAGFTRGAFYSNFDSKDELCVAILASHGEKYLAAAREAITGLDPLTPGQDITGIISRATGKFIAATGADADTILVMSELRLYAAREPALRKAFDEFDQDATPIFGEMIEHGLEANGLRLTIPMDDALSLLHAIYDQTALDQLIRGEAPDSPEAAERLTLVLQALIVPA
ncbi:TetR/AcrR family transcriptional regulator [Luteococcus peritonei]|uniref:TetR/AcrR family transcriptional regulator n=1 Tax=Luteococcus peritonei TaxID=88874 RepID=A0ABW4RYK6_9ACTN